MQALRPQQAAWVLWDGPIDTFSMLRPRNQPVQLQHTPSELPSRTADHLFWLGRYAERSESIARLLRLSLDACPASQSCRASVSVSPARVCFGLAHSTCQRIARPLPATWKTNLCR